MPQFQILGPIQVSSDDTPVPLGPAKQRAVLACLLVDTGRSVTIETLIDRLWGAEPPPAARTVLYAHVTRIRRILEQVRIPWADMPRIGRSTGGYLLRAEPGQVDLHCFRRLVADSRSTGCSDEERAALLRHALDLWRGTPLAGIPGEWAARVREALDRQRLSAVTQWAEAELHLGHHAAVADHVYELLPDYPFAESLVVQLMLALHYGGRTAEATDVYTRTRSRLIDEMGLDPGPGLRRTHEAILQGIIPAVGVHAHLATSRP